MTIMDARTQPSAEAQGAQHLGRQADDHVITRQK
jgi:hypothetical protein